jgi:hypothetical protein
MNGQQTIGYGNKMSTPTYDRDETIGNSSKTHTSSTTCDPEPSTDDDVDLALASVCYVFAICGTLANILVIVVIISQKTLRKPSHVYVLCLAVLDGTMSAFIMPFQGRYYVNTGH